MRKFALAITIFVIIVLLLVNSPAYAIGGGWTVFVPIVVKSQSTPVSTVAPTPTTVPNTPIPIGHSIHFKGWEKGINFSGIVESSEFRQSLTPDFGSAVSAQGKFLVVVMNITNNGLQGDSVDRYMSFVAKDTANRQFDLADIFAQMAAKDQYNLGGVYTTIQPGFTARMVFVFDVLPASPTFTLISLSPW
jgi:hypothetical protein